MSSGTLSTAHLLDCFVVSTKLNLLYTYPVLHLGADTAVACCQVRGVDISSDLSLDYHVSRICVGCYYRLRQLHHIRQSLDSDSLATLVYAVVYSRIDYCNTVLAGAPRTVMDKLQHVLNAAACIVTVSRPPALTLGDSCVPATVNFLQYHVTGSILMVSGPFQWTAPQSGTLSQILSGT